MRTRLIISLFVVVLTGCAQGPGYSQERGGPAKNVTKLTEIRFDTARVLPLSAPLNVSMKPIQRVPFTQIETYPSSPNVQIVMKGWTWFDRSADDLIRRNVELDSIRIENTKAQLVGSVPIHTALTYEFRKDGTIWKMSVRDADFPVENPTTGLNDASWASIRASLVEYFDLAHPGAAFRCAFDFWGLPERNVTAGFSLGPTDREAVIDRFLDCTFAAVRGGANVWEEQEAMDELRRATPTRLTQIRREARAGYSDWIDAIGDAYSTLAIRGTMIENGREFLYADGNVVLKMIAEGKSLSAQGSIKYLIDPFTGLIYKAQAEQSRSTDIAGDIAEEFLSGNGGKTSYLAEIPKQVPTVISVGQPTPQIEPASPGSLAEMYSQAVKSVFLVTAGESIGTGFTISSSDVVTAAHVVKDGSDVAIVTPDGRSVKVTVVAVDERRDLALLRVTGAPFASSLTLAQDLPATGAQIAIIGCPLDPELCGTLTTGIVSFSARPISGVTHVQVDAAVNNGNSGGPILNLAGQVVGVAVAKLTDVSIEGLSFGVASPEVISFLRENQLTASVRPWALDYALSRMTP